MEDPQLDDEIINYYSDQRLSTNRLESLLEESRLAKKQAKQQGHNLPPTAPLVAVTGVSVSARCTRFLRKIVQPVGNPVGMTLASFTLLAGLVWFSGAGLFKPAPDNTNNLTSLMLREAALNHQSKLEVEYYDSDLLALSQSMERLDFELDVPAEIADSYTLLGGRYCTLAGNLAVHLRLQPKEMSAAGSAIGLNLAGDNAAERSSVDERSVFVTLVNKELAALGELSHIFPDKIAVSSWQQGDLFYLVADSGGKK